MGLRRMKHARAFVTLNQNKMKTKTEIDQNFEYKDDDKATRFHLEMITAVIGFGVVGAYALLFGIILTIKALTQ